MLNRTIQDGSWWFVGGQKPNRTVSVRPRQGKML